MSVDKDGEVRPESCCDCCYQVSRNAGRIHRTEGRRRGRRKVRTLTGEVDCGGRRTGWDERRIAEGGGEGK